MWKTTTTDRFGFFGKSVPFLMFILDKTLQGKHMFTPNTTAPGDDMFSECDQAHKWCNILWDASMTGGVEMIIWANYQWVPVEICLEL